VPYAKNDNVSLYYEDHGAGAPIVFVHEFAGDYRAWNPQVHGLSRRFRCITYNARGYPPSSVPEKESDYGYEQAVDDVCAVMDACGIEKAHVVGLSMGGYAATCFAMLHPERARSVVISAAGSGSDPQSRDAFMQDTARFAKRLDEVGMDNGIDQYANGPSRKPLLEKDPLGFAEFFRNFGEHSATGSARTLRGFQMGRPPIYAFAEALHHVNVPALVIVGDRDEACLKPSYFLHATIPGARLCVLPNSGHCVNLEEPDLYNHFVESFVSEIERR
jgi:pimeloyl-ACP methyl ester carboxylesterase